MKLASDYSGLSFVELLELDCISYRVLVRDAFIHRMKETKEGREYLEDAYYLTLTSPDKAKLQNRFGKEV